jgi:hypothetical protein
MATMPRVIVIGGGPIGVEAAAYGRAAGLDVLLLERQQIAANMRNWGFLRMFTPWRLNTTPLGRQVVGNDPLLDSDLCSSAHEFVERYVAPLAESPLLDGCIDTGVRVIAVGRDDTGADRSTHPYRILTCDRFGQEQIDHADVVLDCTGTYGNRRWAGRGGMPAVGEVGVKSSIWYTVPDVLFDDRTRFENRRTLLIGAGTAALTLLSHFAAVAEDAPQTRVVWALRRWGEVLGMADEDPLPQRRALAETALRLLAAPPAWLEVIEDATVDRFDNSHGLHAWLRLSDGNVVHRAVDEIVAAIGFRPDESVHDSLPGRPPYVTAAATRDALDSGALSHPDADADDLAAFAGEVAVPAVAPDYYLLGHKSFGTNSNFLLRVGHRQVREVYRRITGDAALDLYSQEVSTEFAAV